MDTRLPAQPTRSARQRASKTCTDEFSYLDSSEYIAIYSFQRGVFFNPTYEGSRAARYQIFHHNVLSLFVRSVGHYSRDGCSNPRPGTGTPMNSVLHPYIASLGLINLSYAETHHFITNATNHLPPQQLNSFKDGRNNQSVQACSCRLTNRTVRQDA